MWLEHKSMWSSGSSNQEPPSWVLSVWERKCSGSCWPESGHPSQHLQVSQISSFACNISLRGLKALVEDHKCVTAISKHSSRSQGVGTVSVHCAPAPQLCDGMTLTILVPTHFNCFPELHRNKNHSYTIVSIEETFLPSQPQITFGIY